ncbi:hypothetical protein EPN18_09770 [bacterium]|nr:MAG: hypothetical protein EPN18_09770 [bacterium]
MKSLSEIVNIIRSIKALSSDADVANLLGIKPKTLATAKVRNSIPYEVLTSFCNSEKLSLNWLLTGDGSKYRGEDRPFRGPELASYEGDLVEVQVFALAGAGDPRKLTTGEPIETLILPKEFMLNYILPVRVEGDSMTPTLNDGATVGIDTHDIKITSGKVYVVWLDYEGAVIKRVFVEPERIVLKSDNPLFPPSYIALRDAPEHFVMGRVKWVIQKL